MPSFAPFSPPAWRHLLLLATLATVGLPAPASGQAVGARSPARANAPARGPTVERVSIEEVAKRIAASEGRPSVVLLYGTRCPLSRRMFGEFVALARRHPAVDFHVFSTDEELAAEVPAFLRGHGASFPPAVVRDWAPGALFSAMESVGFRLRGPAGSNRTQWVRPFVGVRNSQGYVMGQGQGITNLAPIEALLEHMR